MPTNFTQKDDIIIQSYFTFVLIVELKNNRLLDSEYYEQMNFGSPWIKDALRHIKIDNQGCLLLGLYAMLVIPREIVQKKYQSEYDNINSFLENHTRGMTKTTYQSDSPNVNYLRHIRNAVAHARVEFRPNDVVIFHDENTGKKEKLSTELKLAHVGELLQKLQNVHLNYIDDLKKRK